MKILHVVSSMNPDQGGVVQAIRSIIQVLSSTGYEHTVVCVDDPATAYPTENISIHKLGPSKGPWQQSKALGEWLLKNTHQYDVVISHGLWLYCGYAAARAIRQLKKSGAKAPRFFVMPHGMLDPYFQKSAKRFIKAVRNWIFWKVVESGVVHEADGLLFTCEEEKLLARQTFSPYKPKAELITRLGVAEPPVFNPDMEQAFRAKLPDLGTNNYLLFLSRIHEKKGVDILVDAYADYILHRKGSEDPPHLVIAGPGLETEYGKSIQSKAATAALAGLIHFPGMLIGDPKWGAFYGADAFLLPSHQENFGIAIVEALACGTPVVITNKINIWREIAEANGGFVNSDDSAGFIKALQQWTNLSVAEQSNMSTSAQRAFHTYFSFQIAKQDLDRALASK